MITLIVFAMACVIGLWAGARLSGKLRRRSK